MNKIKTLHAFQMESTFYVMVMDRAESRSQALLHNTSTVTFSLISDSLKKCV